MKKMKKTKLIEDLCSFLSNHVLLLFLKEITAYSVFLEKALQTQEPLSVCIQNDPELEKEYSRFMTVLPIHMDTVNNILILSNLTKERMHSFYEKPSENESKVLKKEYKSIFCLIKTTSFFLRLIRNTQNQRMDLTLEARINQLRKLETVDRQLFIADMLGMSDIRRKIEFELSLIK